MSETLTGRAAVEALQFYTDAGSASARFDSRRVAKAMTTRHGRRSLRRALAVAVARLPLTRPYTVRQPRQGRRPRPRRRATARAASPGRPAGEA